MAGRPTEIVTRFVMDGLANARTGFRRLEQTIRDGASRASAATTDLARRAGAAVKRQFANVVDASISQATKRIDQATKGLGALAKATKNVGFSALEKSAKIAFAGIGAAALAAAAKVGLAMKVTQKSANDLSAADLRRQQTGVSVGDQKDLEYISEKQGTGRGDIISALQSVAGTIRDAERSRRLVQEASQRSSGGLKLALPWARRAEDSETLNTLIAQSRSAGMANIDSVERRMGLLQLRMRDIQRGRTSNRIAERTIRNGADDAGIAEYRKIQAQLLTPLIAEFQELGEAMHGLRESMGPAGRALEDMKDFGLDANVALSGGVEGLAEIAEALQNFDPKRQEELVRGLFGDLTHLPVLRGGRAGVMRDQAEQRRYTGVTTDADGVRSSDLKAAELARSRSVEGLELTVAREVSPLLAESNRQFADWLAKNRDRIAGWVKETFIAARKIVYDVGRLIDGDTNFESGLFKKTAAIIAWSKDTISKAKTVVVTVAQGVYAEFSKIFSGMDSNWSWLNTIRDAFLTIKSLATDVFAVFTGGDAIDFTWLNTARDSVLDFFDHLQEAWGMFKRVLDAIHGAIKPILGWFNTDIMTAVLFVGMLKMSGILKGILGLAGRLVPAFGALFTGMGAAAFGVAGQIAGIGLAFLGALKVGEMAGAKLAEGLVAKYAATQDKIAEMMRMQDAKYVGDKYAKADLDGKVGMYKAMYGHAYGRTTRAEDQKKYNDYVAGERNLPIVIKSDGSAATNEELFRAKENLKNHPGSKRTVDLNFNLNGKSFLGNFADKDAAGLEQELKRTLRLD